MIPQLLLANPGAAVIQKLRSSGFIEIIGRDKIFLTVGDAVKACAPKAREDVWSTQSYDDLYFWEFMFIRIKRKNCSYSLDVCAPCSLSFSLRKKKGEKENLCLVVCFLILYCIKISVTISPFITSKLYFVFPFSFKQNKAKLKVLWL